MDDPSAPAIVWFRRDLRLHDQPALGAAIASAGETGSLTALYVLDPRLLRGRWTSSNRTWFLLGSLRALDADLRALGSRLHVRVGDPAAVVAALAAAVHAPEVHVTADVSPYGRRRDAEVGAALAAAGASLVAHPGLLVHEPDAVLTRDGRPYVVFGPYRRTWTSHPRRMLVPTPERLPPSPAIDSGPIPTLDDLGLPPPTADPATFPAPGERSARRRLQRWLEVGITAYAHDRDRLDRPSATSGLSQDLRFGLLSPVELVERAAAKAGAARRGRDHEGDAGAGDAGASERGAGGERDRDRSDRDDAGPSEDGPATWLAELCWRDFYLQLLAHHPDLLRRPFRRDFERLAWVDDPVALRAWREGSTGHPTIDAAMRQLVATGSIPNRARMIVASYLAKDLLVDWREGEAHFMRHLVDGEPAANDGGWQWSASTGTDPQPWFRVFDPVSQGRRFDPDGSWVRRWVPELARVPTPFVHAPWTMPRELQAAVGCRIGRDYPSPIVDHALARARWFAAVADAGIVAGARHDASAPNRAGGPDGAGAGAPNDSGSSRAQPARRASQPPPSDRRTS